MLSLYSCIRRRNYFVGPIAAVIILLFISAHHQLAKAFVPSIGSSSGNSVTVISSSRSTTDILPSASTRQAVAADRKNLGSSFLQNIFSGQQQQNIDHIMPASADQDPYAVAARGDWRAYLDTSDQQTGQLYYFNVVTGVSQWTRPRDFPAIHLTTAEKKQALKLQESYREQVADQVDQAVCDDNNSNNWLVSGLQFACDRVCTAASVFAQGQPKTLQVEREWKAYKADDSQANTVYYYNTVTGESQWKPPTPTFPSIQSSVSKRIVEETAPPHLVEKDAAGADECVGNFGDWKAYFDANDSCLVYYVNERTGESQWEAPHNFPSVSLKPTQLAKMAVKRQQVALWEESNTSTSPWDSLWKAASTVLQKKVNDNKNSKEQRKSDEPSWWNPFHHKDAESEPQNHHSFDLMATAMSLFQQRDKEQDMDQVLYYEVKRDFIMPEPKQHHHNPLLENMFSHHHAATTNSNDDDDDDYSATRKIPSLEEKRLADSEKRQANLRRNYERVIVDRSPTVSLTALKSTGKQWHQYLDD